MAVAEASVAQQRIEEIRRQLHEQNRRHQSTEIVASGATTSPQTTVARRPDTGNEARTTTRMAKAELEVVTLRAGIERLLRTQRALAARFKPESVEGQFIHGMVKQMETMLAESAARWTEKAGEFDGNGKHEKKGAD